MLCFFISILGGLCGSWRGARFLAIFFGSGGFLLCRTTIALVRFFGASRDDCFELYYVI